MSLNHLARKKRLSSADSLRKNRFSGSQFAVYVVMFGLIGAFILWRIFAAPAPPTVYLTPASAVYGTNTSYSVQVRENSATTNVNAVQANLSYNASLIDFVSIDTTGSAFTTQAQSSGGSGVINIARGVAGGVTGDQLVATINFKTKTTGGTSSVPFTSGTALVSSSTNLDILGSLAATGGGSYTVDTAAPTVALTTPAGGATLAVGSVTNITATASDAASAVTKVEFYIDNALASTVTTSPYTFAWNTAGLSLGSHSISAKAYDTFNNSASTPTISVTLADQTAPTAPGNFRATGATTTSISLAWNASTDNIGVLNYKIKRGATLVATITPPAALTFTDTSLTASTSYTYTIQAFDAAGNASSTTTLTTSTPAAKIGDLNNDNKVDIFDLSILLSNYGTSTTTGDLNADNKVDIFDLSILLSHYGT